MGKFHGVIIPHTPTDWRTLLRELVCIPKASSNKQRRPSPACSRSCRCASLHVAADLCQDLAHFTRHVFGELFFATAGGFCGRNRISARFGAGTKRPLL